MARESCSHDHGVYDVSMSVSAGWEGLWRRFPDDSPTALSPPITPLQLHFKKPPATRNLSDQTSERCISKISQLVVGAIKQEQPEKTDNRTCSVDGSR